VPAQVLRPSTSAPTLPTPLDLPGLAALTHRYAAEVRAGRHTVVVDPDRRWYHRLHSDDAVDVWLIAWATEQAAELHDHGSSLGALTVVHGALIEDRWLPERGELRRRRLPAGRSAAFDHGHVHEVSNPAADAAVSVHAYSPPLTEMSYYALDRRDNGTGLVRTRTIRTDKDSTEGIG